MAISRIKKRFSLIILITFTVCMGRICQTSFFSQSANFILLSEGEKELKRTGNVDYDDLLDDAASVKLKRTQTLLFIRMIPLLYNKNLFCEIWQPPKIS